MAIRRQAFALVLAAALALGAAGAARAQQVYWLDARYDTPTLNRANPDGTNRQFIALPAGSQPEGLALDPVQHCLFWTEAAYTGADVWRCNLDLTFPTQVSLGLSSLRGIASNSANGRLFWTSSNAATGPVVRRANVNGSALTTIVSLGATMNPRGIAYAALPSPAIYMADLASDALYKYDVNGVGAQLVALPVGTRPYGVAVDETNAQVYFTEYGLGRISKCTTTGTNRLLVLAGLLNPTYIALDVPGNHMFWVEGGPGAQRVMRSALNGTSTLNLGLPETTYGGIAYAPASAITGVDGEPAPSLMLGPVSPNPAFGRARVDFALTREGPVRLSLFDVQGRELLVLDDGVRAAGRHSVPLDAAAVRPGMYFVRLRAEGAEFTRRVVLGR